jgi:hypothetical protein
MSRCPDAEEREFVEPLRVDLDLDAPPADPANDAVTPLAAGLISAARAQVAQDGAERDRFIDQEREELRAMARRARSVHVSDGRISGPRPGSVPFTVWRARERFAVRHAPPRRSASGGRRRSTTRRRRSGLVRGARSPGRPGDPDEPHRLARRWRTSRRGLDTARSVSPW